MDKNKMIILALIVVIAALLVGMAAMMMPNMGKQDTKLKFKSNSTMNEGDSLKIKLTDANGTAIANQTVNITITNKNGASDNHSVVTNAKGVGTLKLDKGAGKYNITVSYGGNDKYNGCNATKKITIEEKVVEATVSQSNNNNNQESSFYDKITVHRDPVSGGSITDLSQLSQDEYAQYLGYSDAEEMNRETERKRQEAYARHG